ncbi:hypothetical protein [Methylosinus sp. Ce-a6]|uniref:hypothetical protein n=1 Tax=Methylosinus sp. Ce-a6 TaxID=2172005 RepID=UPI00135878B8|nr:hypothetical protein [Methylosinus sp. Ce-a6]
MANSMALWYECWRENASNITPAEVEVHLNLWRHIARTSIESNFLDVGLLFSNAYEIGAVYLFIPTEVDEGQIEDLSGRLQNNRLLSAVFNDVIRVGTNDENGCFSTIRRNAHYLNFHSAKLNSDFSLSPVYQDRALVGTLIRFERSFCQKLHSPGRQYIRIRFNLNEKGACAFSIKRNGHGDFIVSTILSEEFTELRFNEMRNLPRDITQRIGIGRAFNINAMHCFLIRDMSFELVASHASMHKMRRMEDDLWCGYLPPSVPKRDLSKMLVYHWRNMDATGIDSFVTLARFRQPREALHWYVPGIVALGAIGSGVEGSISNYFGDSNLKATGSLLVGVAVILLIFFSGRWLLRRLKFTGWRRVPR